MLMVHRLRPPPLKYFHAAPPSHQSRRTRTKTVFGNNSLPITRRGAPSFRHLPPSTPSSRASQSSNLPKSPPICHRPQLIAHQMQERSLHMTLELQAPPVNNAAAAANARLVIPRNEALKLIKAQIERGLEIKRAKIRYVAELERAREAKGEWT